MKPLWIAFAGVLALNASEPPALSEAQTRKALDAIQSTFVEPAMVNPVAAQQAQLQGFFQTLDPGLEWKTPATDNAEIPFLAEVLNDKTGYIRPGALSQSALEQTDAALESFASKNLPALILDLRALDGGSDFESAAGLARRFITKGKILFTLEKTASGQERMFTSDRESVFRGVLIVLIDTDSTGATEALAGALKVHASALTVGAKTPGKALDWSEVDVGGGQVLRIASARVVVPEHPPLFPNGVMADITVDFPRAERDLVFQKTRERGVAEFLVDPAPARLNEAALVAGTNPEITPDNESQANERTVRDPVLRRALDLATAVSFFGDRPR
jgi:hypothetical protein